MPCVLDRTVSTIMVIGSLVNATLIAPSGYPTEGPVFESRLDLFLTVLRLCVKHIMFRTTFKTYNDHFFGVGGYPDSQACFRILFSVELMRLSDFFLDLS